MATDFPAVGRPPMIGQRLSISDWLEYVATYNFGSIPPTRVVLHHTYIPNISQWRGLDSMRGMQAFYAGKGWTAAPHMYVGPDGIWLFTPMKDVGIHAGTGNSGRTNGTFWYSIGCEMVGYYDKERPSGAVWEGTKAVLGGLSKRLGIAPRQLISFHRDYTNQKSCPGWAVTKDWVFAEVDAWLNNQQPPPPPPIGTTGTPSPDQEQLADVLLEASYSRRGEGYNSDWAFHQLAVQQNLGYPIGKSGRIDADGKSYAYQTFARDTLYNEIPNWGEVQKLSALLGGAIPGGGFGRALLERIYSDAGATFHADWAFHQFAVKNGLGAPIGGSATLTIGGVQYSAQTFAQDTLYNRVPNWSDVRRVSDLAAATDGPTVQLRNELLKWTYSRVGATYHADWAFHQLARGWKLGSPLSDSYRVSAGAAQYAIQVYANDTLYNVVPNWSDVRRVSALVGPKTATLGPERPATALLSPDAKREPAPAAFHIIQFSDAKRGRTGYGERSRSKISLIVLHNDPGPADRSITIMTTQGTRASTHYYITNNGAIMQLVDDQFAAWHAGMATWRGRRQNINRISLGVTLEDGAPEGGEQARALVWLLGQLRDRYTLPESAVVQWVELPQQRTTNAT